MPAEELRSRLDELHHTLADADQLDEETVATLQRVAADIQRVLQQARPDGPGVDADAEPAGESALDLRHNVQTLMLQFETQHPRITEMLARIANALANLGI